MTDCRSGSRPLLAEALDATATERNATNEELAAWASFARRISETPDPGAAATQPAGGGPATRVLPGTPSSSTPTQGIRTAFEETVRRAPTVEEYESEPAAQMARDLGRELAAAVYGSADPPGNLRTLLQRAVHSVCENRRRVIRRVDEEERSLRSYRSELAAIRRELGEYEAVYPDVSAESLFVYHEGLGELREACRDLAVDRQESLHESMGPEYDRREYVAYLYRDCSRRFPVLAAVAEMVTEIRRFRTSIERDLAGIDGTRDSRTS